MTILVEDLMPDELWGLLAALAAGPASAPVAGDARHSTVGFLVTYRTRSDLPLLPSYLH
jgi:hypothetical protein